MNDNKDSQPDEEWKAFERRLMQLPLRRAPEGLLPTVMDNARGDRKARVGKPASATVPWSGKSWWRELIWPNPRAWGCVAAGWVVIAVAQWSLPSPASPGVAELARSWRNRSQDPESLRRVREQREMLARLLGTPITPSTTRNPEAGPQILYWNPRRRGNVEDNLV